MNGFVDFILSGVVESIQRLLIIFICVFICIFPLAIWKMIDIIVWVEIFPSDYKPMKQFTYYIDKMRVFEILSSEYGYGADTHSWGKFKNFSEILSVIFEIDKSDKLNINRVVNTLKNMNPINCYQT